MSYEIRLKWAGMEPDIPVTGPTLAKITVLQMIIFNGFMSIRNALSLSALVYNSYMWSTFQNNL